VVLELLSPVTPPPVPSRVSIPKRDSVLNQPLNEVPTRERFQLPKGISGTGTDQLKFFMSQCFNLKGISGTGTSINRSLAGGVVSLKGISGTETLHCILCHGIYKFQLLKKGIVVLEQICKKAIAGTS